MKDAWLNTTKDMYLHSHFALHPSDERLNYWETLRLHLQNECLGYAITPTWAPHTPSEEKPFDKIGEVWIGWANEWSKQKSMPWFYKKLEKNLPSTAKQGQVTTFIDLF